MVAIVFYMGFEILERPKDGKDGHGEDVKGQDTEAEKGFWKRRSSG